MPQKRGEVVEKVDASEMMPDIYEKWLKTQRSGNARAKSGYIGSQDTKLNEEAAEDRQEDKVEGTEASHEKAKRRKKGGRTG